MYSDQTRRLSLMPSESPSEASELSISDTEPFADIHGMSPPFSPALGGVSPSPTAEAGDSVSSVDQELGACKHPKYYFDDGSTVFLVCNINFVKCMASDVFPGWGSHLPPPPIPFLQRLALLREQVCSPHVIRAPRTG